MRSINLALIIIFTLALGSCQKEYSIVDPDPTPNLIDSTYSSNIYFDTLNVSTNKYDTIINLKFFYDSKKRVTNIKFNDLTQNILMLEYHFYYNNNDTIPYQSGVSGGAISTPSTSYHFFDQQGRKTSDSTLEGGFVRACHYNYLADKMIYTHIEGPQAGILTITEIDTLTLDTRKNVTNVKKYRKDIGVTFYLWEEKNYTYDNNPNPFYIISTSKVFNIFSDNYNYIDRATPNNIVNTKVISYSPPPTVLLRSYNYYNFYSYKPNGLVENITSASDNGPDNIRILFSYIDL